MLILPERPGLLSSNMIRMVLCCECLETKLNIVENDIIIFLFENIESDITDCAQTCNYSYQPYFPFVFTYNKSSSLRWRIPL